MQDRKYLGIDCSKPGWENYILPCEPEVFAIELGVKPTELVVIYDVQDEDGDC
jgi:hypothetical protein